jgi:hypothetical protein
MIFRQKTVVRYLTTRSSGIILPHNEVVWYFAAQCNGMIFHQCGMIFDHTIQWYYFATQWSGMIFRRTMQWCDISPWYDILRSSEACQRGSCGTVKPFNSIGWHHSSKAIAIELINYFEVMHDLSHTSIIREWYIYSMRNLDDTFTKKRSQDILG